VAISTTLKKVTLQEELSQAFLSTTCPQIISALSAEQGKMNLFYMNSLKIFRTVAQSISATIFVAYFAQHQ